RRQPRSTLFPYTTLCRSAQECSVLFMLIIDCSHRFKSLFQLFESLSIFWVYSGFISLLVCCAQIGLGLLQLSFFVSKLFWTKNALCGFMLFSGAQYNFDAISRVRFSCIHFYASNR